jgi:hypothetical protein
MRSQEKLTVAVDAKLALGCGFRRMASDLFEQRRQRIHQLRDW